MEEPAISQCVLNPILLQGNENISMEIVTGKRRKTDVIILFQIYLFFTNRLYTGMELYLTS